MEQNLNYLYLFNILEICIQVGDPYGISVNYSSHKYNNLKPNGWIIIPTIAISTGYIFNITTSM